MAKLGVRPTNGVSYGVIHPVSAGDASDGYVEFDFRVPGSTTFRYGLVASVLVTAETTDVVTNPADLAISYPYAGGVRVEGTLVADSVIHLIAQRAQVI